MIVLKKNQIVTIAMAGLVVLAGYINYAYTDKIPKTEENISASAPVEDKEDENNVENYGEAHFVNAEATAKNDYFNETKMKKETSRSESIALIREIAESETADPESRKTAQASIIKIAGNIEKEANIENILMGKGYSDTSVYINDGGVTVAVLTEGLKPEDIARIRDVVISETGITAEEIKIMEIK